MTPKEKKEAANKVLDDTMTVSQAKQRKLDLRAKDLDIRAGSLKRKQKNDADAKARRAKASADKDAKEKESAQDKKNAAGTAGVIARKKRKEASEKKKLEKIRGIADKRKAGVKKSLSRAKEVAAKGKSKVSITKDEGELSAELKVAKSAAKSTVAGARAGLNLGKAAAKGIGAGIAGAKAKRAQGKEDAKERKIDKRNDKLDKARDKKVGDRLNRRRMSKLGKLNPFRAKSDGDSKSASSSSDKAAKPTDSSPKTKSAAKVEKKPEAKKPEVKTPTKKSAAEDPLKKASSAKEPKKPTKSSAAKDPLAKAAGKKPVDQKVEKVKVKVEEPKKISGSKRLAVKRAAGKAKDLAKKAANNPEVRKAAKTVGKAVVRKAVSKLSDKKVQPARKALPSGQKALPPAGGVDKPKPQSSTTGSGNMSDAQRARKDPKFRRELIAKRSKGMNEEFYQYLLEIEKKSEDKINKVIDVMRGKNTIEISPSVKEEVTGGILIQDAEDYTPLEIETVDVIEADPIKEGIGSAITRAGIKVGGKKGGRAVQAGGRAAAKKGKDVVAKSKEGNKKKMVGDGKYEKLGAKVGAGVGGVAGVAIPDGPAMVAGEIAGGIAGSKVGGKIGRQIDKFRAKNAKKKDEVKEEASDAMKDRQLERGGMGARRAPKKPISNTPNTFGKKKPSTGGPSAMDVVKAKIRAQYGDKAIMDTKKTKKEGFSDWRSDLIVEKAPVKVPLKDTGNPLQNAWNKFVPPPESSANPNVRSGLRKPGKLEAPLLKKANATAKSVNKPIKAAGQATKGLRAAGDFIKNNPGKSALIGAGVVGAGVLAAKALGGGKKKEKNEHYDWRSDMGVVQEGEGEKDACYKKVKASAKVWPSAYASGRLVQCRKKGAANYGKSKSK
jgi:hypothetical protein